MYRNNWMRRNEMPIVNFCKTFGKYIFNYSDICLLAEKNHRDWWAANIDFDKCALATGIFTDSLKIAKVIILYKRTRHGSVDNYGTVSLSTSFQLYSKKLQIQLTKLLQNQPRLLAQVRPTTLLTEPPAVLTTVATCTRAVVIDQSVQFAAILTFPVLKYSMLCCNRLQD